MQERIGPSWEPINPKDLKKDGSRGTNPVLFAQLQDFLYVNTRSDLLLKALQFLEALHDGHFEEAARIKGLPLDKFGLKAAEKLKNLQKLLPHLQDLERALKEGNFKQAASLLPELIHKMGDAKTPLPPHTQKALLKGFDQLLNQRGADGKTLNRLSFLTYLGEVVVAAQGNWGSDEDATLGDVMDKLKKLASAQPPTPFSKEAKALLEQFQESGDEKMLLKMTKPGEEQVSELLKEGNFKEAVRDARKAVESALHPENQSDHYLQELELESTLQSTMEGIEKAVKLQQEHCKGLVDVLIKASPRNTKLQDLSAQFAALKIPPKNDVEAEETRRALHLLFGTYNKMVQNKEISRQDQRLFLDKMKNFLDEAIKACEEGSQNLIDKTAQLRKQHEELGSALDAQSGVEQGLTSIESGEKVDQEKFLEALMFLESKIPTLPKSEQSTFSDMIVKLSQLAPGKDLAHLLSSQYLSKMLREFSASGSQSDFKKWLDDRISSLKSRKSGTLLWQQFIAKLDEEKEKPGFPETLEDVSTLKFQESGIDEVIEKHEELKEALTTQQNRLQSQIKGREEAGRRIDAHSHSLYSAKADVSNKRLMTPASEDEDIPLPQQFANVIFGKVIPNQNEALMAAGELLQFFNTFSAGCNDILSDMAGWSSATYDLNSFLTSKDANSTPPAWNMTPSTAANQTQSSIKQTEQDYSALYNSVQDITKQIQAIKNGPNPNDPTNQAQLQKLNGYLSALIDGASSLPVPGPHVVIPTAGQNCTLNNFAQAYSSYNSLYNYFSGIKPQNSNTTPFPADGTGDPTTQAAYDALNGKTNADGTVVIPPLTTVEQNVVNGTTPPTTTPPTPANGLHAIYNVIQSDQTNYSSLSQNQSQELQMTMTMSQQLFATITSAMQDLNNSYKDVATAISK